MKQTILVAGATGNLGGRIITALLAKDVEVRAVVRLKSDPLKVKKLENLGVKVFEVDMSKKEEVAKVCKGVTCVVSALAGLRETIIGTQKVLLDGAVLAGVPRFIPSDYSLDFRNLTKGGNRNLDLRKEFHEYLDKSSIAATTVFNGAFMDLLTKEMPMILFKVKRILYWSDADQSVDFTTMDDTASFTANVALDENSPRFLRIAGDQITPREMAQVVSKVTGDKFGLLRAGGIGMLNTLIKIGRTLSPAKKDLYPAWQGMQYMRDMMEGKAKAGPYANNRYEGMKWTTIKDFLESYERSEEE